MKKKMFLKEIEVALMPIPDVIVLPHTATSFSLSDEYYLRMIREVVKNNEFMIVSMTDPVNSPNPEESKMLRPRSMGVLVTPTLLGRQEDGSEGILFHGQQKVKIMQIVSKTPYLKCRAVVLPEDLSFDDFIDSIPYIHLKTILNTWIDQNVDGAQLRESFKATLYSPDCVLNYLTLFIITCRETKQLVLETLSILDRFDILTIIFKYKQQLGPSAPLTADILRMFMAYDQQNVKGH